MNNSFIYLRALRHVDYSVFCVADGQKTYFDPVFNQYVPFSSGQQVKTFDNECYCRQSWRTAFTCYFCV